jgi:hypothetical protein
MIEKLKKTKFIPLYSLGILFLSLTFALAGTMTIEIGDAKVIKFDTDVSEIFIAIRGRHICLEKFLGQPSFLQWMVKEKRFSMRLLK